MKHIIRELLEDHLRFEKRVRSHELTARSGLSRQVVHRHLRRLVLSGELLMHGETKGVTYSAGPAWPKPRPPVVPYGERKFEFWSSLKEACPHLLYVGLARYGPFLRTREEARKITGKMPMVGFVVFDFRGITRISEAFAQELFVYAQPQQQPINAIPAVEAVITRMLRLYELRLGTPR